MNTVNETALNFMKSELNKAQIELSHKESGRVAVDFIYFILNISLLIVYFILSIEINW